PTAAAPVVVALPVVSWGSEGGSGAASSTSRADSNDCRDDATAAAAEPPSTTPSTHEGDDVAGCPALAAKRVAASATTHFSLGTGLSGRARGVSRHSSGSSSG